MTGIPTETAEPRIQIEADQSTTEETHEQRAAFFRWLYDAMYETQTPAGALAQQVHKCDPLGFHILRNRCSHAWVRQVHKRKWRIDPALLMSVWNE
jgi:hypothetical protein